MYHKLGGKSMFEEIEWGIKRDSLYERERKDYEREEREDDTLRN